MGDLTRNFDLAEFLVSSTADLHGIKNTPTPLHLKRLREVTGPGMQLVRDYVGTPIFLTSGYRNLRVNRLVGGVPKSDHTEAWATDSRAAALPLLAYARKIAEGMKPGGPLHGEIDQLIMETSRRVVHLSFAPRRRGNILTQPGGPGTPVLKGLVI